MTSRARVRVRVLGLGGGEYGIVTQLPFVSLCAQQLDVVAYGTLPDRKVEKSAPAPRPIESVPPLGAPGRMEGLACGLGDEMEEKEVEEHDGRQRASRAPSRWAAPVLVPQS